MSFRGYYRPGGTPMQRVPMMRGAMPGMRGGLPRPQLGMRNAMPRPQQGVHSLVRMPMPGGRGIIANPPSLMHSNFRPPAVRAFTPPVRQPMQRPQFVGRGAPTQPQPIIRTEAVPPQPMKTDVQIKKEETKDDIKPDVKAADTKTKENGKPVISDKKPPSLTPGKTGIEGTKTEPSKTENKPPSLTPAPSKQSSGQSSEPVRRVPEPGIDEWNLNPNSTTFDTFNSDLNFKIDRDGFAGESLTDPDGFAFCWAGARATYGITSGKVSFEVRVAKNLAVDFGSDHKETDPHVVRVGWSVDSHGLQLGEEPNSFGYGGTGMFSMNNKFQKYGVRFGEGDVIMAMLDMDQSPPAVTYSKNGAWLGVAHKLQQWPVRDRSKALFPHVLVKNCRVEVNFGQRAAWYPPMAGYKYIDHVPIRERVHGMIEPARKNQCEIIMMVGLPGVGKTTWALNKQKTDVAKRYNVIGTDTLIDKMRVMGLPRRRNFGGRWDVLISKASRALNKLFTIGSRRRRNFILDQTNVYPTARVRKMRNFEGFKRVCAVLVPEDKDMESRSERRTREEGKEVPKDAVLEMKANFSLPRDTDPCLDRIDWIELRRDKAQPIIQQYNQDASGHKRQSGPSWQKPSQQTPPPWQRQQQGNDGRPGQQGGRGGGYQDQQRTSSPRDSYRPGQSSSRDQSQERKPWQPVAGGRSEGVAAREEKKPWSVAPPPLLGVDAGRGRGRGVLSDRRDQPAVGHGEGGFNRTSRWSRPEQESRPYGGRPESAERGWPPPAQDESPWGRGDPLPERGTGRGRGVLDPSRMAHRLPPERRSEDDMEQSQSWPPEDNTPSHGGGSRYGMPPPPANWRGPGGPPPDTRMPPGRDQPPVKRIKQEPGMDHRDNYGRYDTDEKPSLLGMPVKNESMDYGGRRDNGEDERRRGGGGGPPSLMGETFLPPTRGPPGRAGAPPPAWRREDDNPVYGEEDYRTPPVSQREGRGEDYTPSWQDPSTGGYRSEPNDPYEADSRKYGYSERDASPYGRAREGRDEYKEFGGVGRGAPRYPDKGGRDDQYGEPSRDQDPYSRRSDDYRDNEREYGREPYADQYARDRVDPSSREPPRGSDHRDPYSREAPWSGKTEQADQYRNAEHDRGRDPWSQREEETSRPRESRYPDDYQQFGAGTPDGERRAPPAPGQYGPPPVKREYPEDPDADPYNRRFDRPPPSAGRPPAPPSGYSRAEPRYPPSSSSSPSLVGGGDLSREYSSGGADYSAQHLWEKERNKGPPPLLSHTTPAKEDQQVYDYGHQSEGDNTSSYGSQPQTASKAPDIQYGWGNKPPAPRTSSPANKPPAATSRWGEQYRDAPKEVGSGDYKRYDYGPPVTQTPAPATSGTKVPPLLGGSALSSSAKPPAPESGEQGENSEYYSAWAKYYQQQAEYSGDMETAKAWEKWGQQAATPTTTTAPPAAPAVAAPSTYSQAGATKPQHSPFPSAPKPGESTPATPSQPVASGYGDVYKGVAANQAYAYQAYYSGQGTITQQKPGVPAPSASIMQQQYRTGYGAWQ